MHNRAVTTETNAFPDRLVPRTPWIHRRWVGPLAGLLAFLLLVIPAAAVGFDYVMRAYEANRLLTRIEASEAAMIAFDAQAQAAVAVLGDGANGASPTDAQVQQARDALTAAARDGQQAIADAGAKVAAVKILAWHGDLAKAREAYLAHNHAWQDYLAAAQLDPAEFDKPQQAINDTFAAAERAMRAGMGGLALFDIRDRLEAIFAPPPQDSGGTSAADGQLAA